MILDRAFIEHVERFIPPGFFVRLIDEFEEDYSWAASQPHDQYEEPEAHDLVGAERRARTETSLTNVARQFGHRGIVANAELNPTMSHYHREIVAGPVLLTASFVPYPNYIVQEARYRETLAMSRQLSFLTGVGPEGKRLYGVLLHGAKQIGRKRYRDTLGFFQLAIPNRSCTAYEAVYNLAERYCNTEIDPQDVAAAMEAGVPIEPVQQPSALLREYRRQVNNEE